MRSTRAAWQPSWQSALFTLLFAEAYALILRCFSRVWGGRRPTFGRHRSQLLGASAERVQVELRRPSAWSRP
jgi:hypothetical protein